ncbi:Restriction endonuclease NotI [Abditibacterium utsteinense]|uniref:Restriction endonuclease NotI n=1 Tax=Abditibacterium utsteinense TaxID=1960156 RepID=A0A2S8SQA3_9BACT|nr:NotI family restriction endonuclease [Abditibacterium utsteinense]PQV62966.1 Restriction endonuclease NotI [Abditibacterium utsteinense]
MPRQPLAEVFGFPIDNNSPQAERHRRLKLCPFNNKVPNCTKDKAKDPLGVCSILQNDAPVITCPVRFREEWLIAEDAAAFFFGPDVQWTSLTEVRLPDKHGKSAGNIDVVLVAYDQNGQVTDFGSLEVQAVYISGNVSLPFKYFMQAPAERADMDWSKQPLYPRADFLSSSRKRLAPQLIFKGGILRAWQKKMAVALDSAFWATLPAIPQVPATEADMAWLIYDLERDESEKRFHLARVQTIYTRFEQALDVITRPEVGDLSLFMGYLQRQLDARLGSAPINALVEPPFEEDADATDI